MNRNKIAEAVERVMGLVDDGETPTAALTKVAKELQLQPDYVKLAAYAYNTGAQEAQRKEGASVLDKLASFPLADGEQAIAMIWGPTITKKASADYNLPPIWYHQRAAKEERARVLSLPLPKAAEAKSSPTEEQQRLRLHKQAMELKAQANLASSDYRLAHENLWGSMAKLADFLKSAQPPHRLLDYEWHAAMTFGDQVQPLFEFVRQRNRSKEAAHDLSKYPLRDIRSMTVDQEQEPWSLIRDCIKAATDTCAKEKKRKQVVDEYTRLKMSCSWLQTDQERWQEEAKQASFISGALGGSLASMGQLLGPGSDRARQLSQQNVQGRLLELEDPTHMAELRKIRAEAMLQDLMANDEVISGYDPDAVIGHYNELSSLVPESALQPAVMRSALRERLQTNPQTFEAGQLADIESKLRQQMRPPGTPTMSPVSPFLASL